MLTAELTPPPAPISGITLFASAAAHCALNMLRFSAVTLALCLAASVDAFAPTRRATFGSRAIGLNGESSEDPSMGS